MEKVNNGRFKNLISTSEPIGTIGSPSSTAEITVDILGAAANKKLVGEVVFFSYNQDDKTHFAMGQIAEIELKNPWLEDPTIRSLVRQKAQVNPVSGKQDTHLGKLSVSAVFASEGNEFTPSIVGTVASTGTAINKINDDILNHVLERYRKDLFYLGNVYGATTRLPLWFKHFEREEKNGAGEAYHIGIFGKTGSGKSTLAQMILLGYARHNEMAIFVIDPVGEFSKYATGKRGTAGFPLNVSQVLLGLNRTLELKNVTQLTLGEWSLFKEILIESGFFDDQLTISNKKEEAADVLADELQHRHIRLSDLFNRQSFDLVWEILQDEEVLKNIYQTREPRTRLTRRIQTIVEDQNRLNTIYDEIWLPVTQLFREDRPGTISIETLIRQTYDIRRPHRPLVIIDLSVEAATALGIFWNPTIQALVIKNLLDVITRFGQAAYRRDEFLNTLVVLDEAHRFARGEKFENNKEEQVRQKLLSLVQETRKYGLGWMFISLSLSNIDRRIINQLSIMFFGYGLVSGSEFDSLKEYTGDSTALKLYQTFQHPRSNPNRALRKYPFMTQGPVSPLSFTGTPLFLTVFTSPDEFLRANNLTKYVGSRPEDEFTP